jgi:hypothetical protein
MKFATITSTAAILASSLALPTDVTYGPPAGGWESIDYPAGTGENLPSYPPPAGGWESVKYPAGTGSKVLLARILSSAQAPTTSLPLALRSATARHLLQDQKMLLATSTLASIPT